MPLTKIALGRHLLTLVSTVVLTLSHAQAAAPQGGAAAAIGV